MKSLFATTCIALGLAASAPAPVQAQGNPWLGQITWVAFGFCPRGWTELNGQILPINSNQSLYSLLGTTFGGNGRTDFGLPEMRGRAPGGVGTSSSGSPTYTLGQKTGAETGTMNTATMPAHTHDTGFKATSASAGSMSPQNSAFGTSAGPVYAGRATLNTDLASGSFTVLSQGGNQSVNTMQPWLVAKACIALQGTFPSRN